ncbi:MAG: hypothetical protein JKY48_05625 [Flavobacteriales bacterium]|nr:hypothetical protein [Flavobacteriales bacterium]
MNTNKTILRALSIFSIAALLFACADAPKKEVVTEQEEEKIVEVPVETTKSEESIADFILPSPIQIAAIFNRAGLVYEGGLANPVSNVSNYNTKTAKYLNFGVYSADLAYAVLNSQQQASIDYINVVRTISDEIGMPSIFGSGALLKSFEKNIDNQDSILKILTTIKSRTDDYLTESGDESKEAIFFSAAWVEGMYLGAKSAKNTAEITPRIIEQMTILQNIINAVKMQKDPSIDLKFLVEGLQNIKKTFEGFEETQDLENKDIDSIHLTVEEIMALNESISALRTKIING